MIHESVRLLGDDYDVHVENDEVVMIIGFDQDGEEVEVKGEEFNRLVREFQFYANEQEAQRLHDLEGDIDWANQFRRGMRQLELYVKRYP